MNKEMEKEQDKPQEIDYRKMLIAYSGHFKTIMSSGKGWSIESAVDSFKLPENNSSEINCNSPKLYSKEEAGLKCIKAMKDYYKYTMGKLSGDFYGDFDEQKWIDNNL